ncbi:MAG: hypothetical protein JWR80_5302 [Bradyrhizobium sp.]|nr:hypothetical protein [Bradyrhizobium sp.]
MKLFVLFAAALVQSASAPAPVVFGPGVISGTQDVDAATFSPDGKTVFFDRSIDGVSTIMMSRRSGKTWSAPVTAPFSGKWSDKDPAMAPDGSFLVFDSNRPASPGGSALDLVRADGSVRAGQGNHLWRVERTGPGWAEPVPLPGIVNDSTRIYSPSVVRDGSVYFQKPDAVSRVFHLVRSQYRGRTYQAPEDVVIGPAGADERDPAVSPDERLMVFSANYGPKGQPNRLYITFREGGRWGAPTDLGDAVNHDGAEGPHLGADGQSAYFDSTAPGPGAPAGVSRIWRLDLRPWLSAHR